MSDIVPYEGQIIECVERPEEVPESVPPEDWTMVREWLRSKRNHHTKRAYERNLETFYQFIASKPLRYVTLTNLQDYADMLVKEHTESATQAQMLASIKSLFSFGQKMGYLQFNVGTAIQLPQGKDKLAERILESSQLHRMIYEAEKGKSKRDYVLLLVLYGSGIRCSELCSLQWKDVQLNRKGGQITVLGKRGKTRSIPLHTKVWETLQAYKPQGVQGTEYVFQSRQTTKEVRRLTESRVWQIVSGIARSAGIDHASPHWLRHTHATRALEGHAPIKLLQETLGHTSLAVTGRYTHVRPEDSSSMYLDL